MHLLETLKFPEGTSPRYNCEMRDLRGNRARANIRQESHDSPTGHNRAKIAGDLMCRNPESHRDLRDKWEYKHCSRVFSRLSDL